MVKKAHVPAMICRYSLNSSHVALVSHIAADYDPLAVKVNATARVVTVAVSVAFTISLVFALAGFGRNNMRFGLRCYNIINLKFNHRLP